jgi:hypothetical protein
MRALLCIGVAGIVLGTACARTPAIQSASPADVAVEGPRQADVHATKGLDGAATSEVTTSESESDLIAKLFLVGPRRPGDVKEATVIYRWVSVGRVYWVSDWKSDRVLVVAAFGGKEAPVCLTGNVAAMSDFLSREFDGRFPKDGLRDLARILKDVAIGPFAAIASEEFLRNQERDGLEYWLKGREKDPSAFEKLVTGIHGTASGNVWEVWFNVFNNRGGVDSLKASGTVSPITVRQLTVEEVKPAGEFYFPLEG